MKEDQDNLIEKVRGIFAIKVKNGAGGKEGYWVINAKTGKGSVTFNGKSKFLFFLQSGLKTILISRLEAK